MSVPGQSDIQLGDYRMLHGHLAGLPRCLWSEIAGAARRITGNIPCKHMSRSLCLLAQKLCAFAQEALSYFGTWLPLPCNSIPNP